MKKETEQQGKELFEWVKVSELKEINEPICIRYDGGGAYAYDTCCSMKELQRFISAYNPIEEIEWLKPVKAEHTQSEIIAGYIHKIDALRGQIREMGTLVKAKEQQEIDTKDLQEQVREHIRTHGLFDWDEALTENEMTYLENLLLTFNPLCPPGSVGFEEQKRHIKAKEQKGNDSDGWVSVETKEFPKNKQLVLFRCDNGLVLSGIYYELDEHYNKHVFNDYQTGYPLDFITHWQPLPLPPKQSKL